MVLSYSESLVNPPIIIFILHDVLISLLKGKLNRPSLKGKSMPWINYGVYGNYGYNPTMAIMVKWS